MHAGCPAPAGLADGLRDLLRQLPVSRWPERVGPPQALGASSDPSGRWLERPTRRQQRASLRRRVFEVVLYVFYVGLKEFSAVRSGLGSVTLGFHLHAHRSPNPSVVSSLALLRGRSGRTSAARRPPGAASAARRGSRPAPGVTRVAATRVAASRRASPRGAAARTCPASQSEPLATEAGHRRTELYLNFLRTILVANKTDTFLTLRIVSEMFYCKSRVYADATPNPRKSRIKPALAQ